MGERLDGWDDACCVVCPAQTLGLGEFDVVDRPGRDRPYDPAAGYRIDIETRVPVCVHPYRVGLPPGAFASGSAPMPAVRAEMPAPAPHALTLPDDVVDLEGWLVAVVRTADSGRMANALADAEAAAGRRFAAADVVTAMRRVLSIELAHRG